MSLEFVLKESIFYYLDLFSCFEKISCVNYV